MAGMRIKTVASGTGPSDQTVFYHDSIPVLHFTSGMTSDYHTPADSEDKINYDGEVSIMHIILKVIDRIDNLGKITFAKTNSERD
jgi:aminopeptidase YwaD